MNHISSSPPTGLKPVILEELTSLAAHHRLNRLILFGSRARGDYHEKSDIDLALSGGDKLRFALDADEQTSTLLAFDFVDLDQALQPALRQSIETEGVILYEKI